MDISKWGETILERDNFIIIIEYNSKTIYYIDIFDNYMKVELKINNHTKMSFVDYPDLKSESPLLNLKRVFKNSVKYFENGIEILYTKPKSVQFLKFKSNDKTMSTNIIIMDIETRAIDGYMWPYCTSIYDGTNRKSFYLSDFNDNIKLLLDSTLEFIMQHKYNNYKVYIHNFSYFDSIFMFKSLYDLSNKIKPIIRDGRFIDLKFNFKDKSLLYFRDSLLLLPTALAKLAKSFKTEYKGIFPYKFVNELNKKTYRIKLYW
jgi:hypothetical protein